MVSDVIDTTQDEHVSVALVRIPNGRRLFTPEAESCVQAACVLATGRARAERHHPYIARWPFVENSGEQSLTYALPAHRLSHRQPVDLVRAGIETEHCTAKNNAATTHRDRATSSDVVGELALKVWHRSEQALNFGSDLTPGLHVVVGRKTWQVLHSLKCRGAALASKGKARHVKRLLLVGRSCRLATAKSPAFGRRVVDAAAVTSLGVDEHVWHHVDPRKRGPKELTGMVDLARDNHGNTRARLLDLVPGRSGKVYATWLGERGDAFRKQVKVAALDPFAGYKTAIDDEVRAFTYCTEKTVDLLVEGDGVCS